MIAERCMTWLAQRLGLLLATFDQALRSAVEALSLPLLGMTGDGGSA